ncbi:MAG TPA: c-type cytochrome [Candidatus Marinimicrobia bacterium]|nr:c-type cytochrome [Candidatus Neomarinimicrobiota bacterium]
MREAVRAWRFFGVISAASLLILVASGWALSANYVPSEADAFASILYLRKMGWLGVFLRSLHFYTSSVLIVAGFLFMLSLYLSGEYRQKRLLWHSGLTVYLLVLAVCFTGYLLPMDQNAYWGTVVRLGIVESTPVLGPTMADLLRGGAVFNASTLARFYSLHLSILPFLIAIVLFPVATRIVAGSAVWREKRVWALSMGFILIMYVLASSVKAPLELPADLSDVDYVARPEWYFLWLFQFGKYVESMEWVRSLLLPLLGIGFLYLLPFLKKQAGGVRVTIAAAWCSVWLMLTALAFLADKDLPDKLNYEAGMLIQAEEKFKEFCIDCHGAGGYGDGPQARAFDLDPPDFTAATFWAEISGERMSTSIREGGGKDMPSFRNKLTPHEIDALVDFLKASFQSQESR